MEKSELRLERLANRRRRRRPQPCKRCAASARKRTKVSRSSLRRVFFSDECLKTRIFAQRIPERIEFQIGNSKSSRDFEKMGQDSNRCLVIAKAGLDLSERDLGLRFGDRVGFVPFDRTLRLLQSFLLFAQSGIGKSESTVGAIRIEDDNR